MSPGRGGGRGGRGAAGGGRGEPGAVARFFVPGRIEVLGKHTDYTGGRSLLVATGRGLTVTARPADDDTLRFLARDTGDATAFRLEPAPAPDAPPSPRPLPGDRPLPGWHRYADAVVRRLADHFGQRLRGAVVEFGGDLPPASGLSSSSALVTGLFLGLDAVCRFHQDPAFLERLPDRESLAAYLAHVERGSPVPGLDDRPHDTGTGERRGVGTRGGSEDHTAILCAEEGRVVRYAFEPVRRLGSVRLPEEWTFAVACSGVTAEKAAGARELYNRLSDRARAAAAAWREATGGVAWGLGPALAEAGGVDRLVEGVEEGAARLGAAPAERAALADRARHFAREVALTDAAYEALERVDARVLGEAAAESQALAEALLGNQVPETVWLAREASARGAIAASAFGAGFGGAVWALVTRTDATAFLRDWERRYTAAFPARARRATFFLTDAAAAAGPQTAAGS